MNICMIENYAWGQLNKKNLPDNLTYHLKYSGIPAKKKAEKVDQEGLLPTLEIQELLLPKIPRLMC